MSCVAELLEHAVAAHGHLLQEPGRHLPRGERVIRRRGVGVHAVDVLAEQAERVAGGHTLIAEEQHGVHADVAHVEGLLQLHQLIDVAEDLVVLVPVRARDEAVDRVGALGVGEVAVVGQRVRPDQLRVRRIGVLAEVVVCRAAGVGRSVGEEHHHVARPGEQLGVGGVEVRDVRGDDPVGVGRSPPGSRSPCRARPGGSGCRCRCRWDGRSAVRSPPAARRSSRWCPRARWSPGRWAGWRTAGSAPEAREPGPASGCPPRSRTARRARRCPGCPADR